MAVASCDLCLGGLPDPIGISVSFPILVLNATGLGNLLVPGLGSHIGEIELFALALRVVEQQSFGIGVGGVDVLSLVDTL